MFCFGAKKVRGTGFPVWAARKIKRERKHEEGEGEGKGKRYAGYVSNRDLKRSEVAQATAAKLSQKK